MARMIEGESLTIRFVYEVMCRNIVSNSCSLSVNIKVEHSTKHAKSPFLDRVVTTEVGFMYSKTEFTGVSC